ncbi:uncharacterized protein [Nicotiana sylvestris]|uniref:uncharacterized protein n=1 Tax=Nicotiana sylvestris TaxID=4096 RepID=UPI00388C92AB
MVKFEWDRQEIVVHDEDNWYVPSDAIVPFIEFEDDKGPWIYQGFDTVSVEKIPEGKYNLKLNPAKCGFGVPSGNEVANALATLASMLHHPDKAYMDPLQIQIHDQHAYCNVVEEELDEEPWFHDIKKYIKMGVYPVQVTGATPYLLVHGTEAVIPAEVEIPSLRIVAEAEIDDDEWVKTRLEQFSLIDEKRLATVYHGQLYQQRMARAYNKKAEAKDKFAPNWQGPFIVTRVLSNGAFYLTGIEDKCVEMPINSDVVKRYYV